MNSAEFLKPVPSTLLSQLDTTSPRSWFRGAQIHGETFPDTDSCKIWLVGVKDDRGTDYMNGASQGPDAIRAELYRLINHQEHLSVADLGNIEAGESINDTHYALCELTKEALEKKKVLIVLGGSIDLAYAQYRAYEKHSRTMRVVSVDSRIELSAPAHNEEAVPYLGNIILHEPNYLFNICHLGYQSYFCEEESVATFNRMNFDAMRLGNLRKNIEEAEPLFRDADIGIFNLSAIRLPDAPAQENGSPNGIGGDEACQLARYAGISNELSSFGLFGLIPHLDRQQQTAKLIAQMLWYFVDGVQSRKYDYPAAESSDFQTYRITFNNSSHEVVFFKSLKSDRWWMEVPYPVEKSAKKGSYLVPCSYKDYETACNDEVPDRWLKTYYKLI